jgi:preprotein translocase subunit YajC
MVGIMYFLIIRPNQRRRKQMVEMQSEVTPGAQVITIGGLHATVVELDDDIAVLEVAPGINLRYARGAINRVVEPGEAAEPEPDTVVES